jgi:hypothetical protein
MVTFGDDVTIQRRHPLSLEPSSSPLNYWDFRVVCKIFDSSISFLSMATSNVAGPSFVPPAGNTRAKSKATVTTLATLGDNLARQEPDLPGTTGPGGGKGKQAAAPDASAASLQPSPDIVPLDILRKRVRPGTLGFRLPTVTPENGAAPGSASRAISSLELDRRMLETPRVEGTLDSSPARLRSPTDRIMNSVASSSLREVSASVRSSRQAPPKTPGRTSVPLATSSPAGRSCAPTTTVDSSILHSILRAPPSARDSSRKRKISMTEEDLALMLERYAAKILASKEPAFKGHAPLGELLFHILCST